MWALDNIVYRKCPMALKRLPVVRGRLLPLCCIIGLIARRRFSLDIGYMYLYDEIDNFYWKVSKVTKAMKGATVVIASIALVKYQTRYHTPACLWSRSEARCWRGSVFKMPLWYNRLLWVGRASAIAIFYHCLKLSKERTKIALLKILKWLDGHTPIWLKNGRL